ncbi:transcriptional regulator [Bacteroidia bacterium]|nr:transcriptional regulator [Bacteroidia bacterium]
MEKLFYTIKEVADMFGVNQSLLRYWETEFHSLKPKKNDKGTRRYDKEDVEEVRLIYYLVKEKGMTLAGAKQKLKENRSNVTQTGNIISRLQNVRSALLRLKTEFDELETDFTSSQPV